jgi:segregation and condensation protein B
MSLKAKIEAVIYASEEPVTLAQLVGLLGQEAQAELDREVAVQQTLLNEAEFEAAASAVPEPGPDFSSIEDVGDVASVSPEEPRWSEARDVAGATEEATAAEPPDGGEPDAAAESPKKVDEVPDTAAARAEKLRAGRLRSYFRELLNELIADYANADRGLEIREVAGGFRFATKPEYHDAVRGFVKSLKPPLKLTLQALETLAVVAYKQPVTSPEISEIRGVDSSGVLGSLIARKLITTAGRKQVIGRPILYKTTKEFLIKFGLKDVAELPSIEEFEKMAGQMAEQEEIAMSDHQLAASATEAVAGELGPEAEAYAPVQGEAPVPVADEAIVDGRISGPPPNYDDASDDPSAEEAAIQSGE